MSNAHEFCGRDFCLNVYTMSYKIYLVISILFCGAIVAVQSSKVARCYQFTWLGPRSSHDEASLNTTCEEVTQSFEGVPCRHPLVVSDDGTWPDVEYIWQHHADEASCVQTQNDVCAQYTYYFNGHVENSTYMCTRGVYTTGEPINSGCYEQNEGGFTIRVCFCRSIPGGVPCNNASYKAISYFIYSFAFLFLLANKKFYTLPFIF